jgi:hypothetical protein
VPLSIIHPALEAASLEEDDDLQDTWANLLANAADVRQPDVMSPSFPLILKELGAREVKFLDVLYQHAEDQVKDVKFRRLLDRRFLGSHKQRLGIPQEHKIGLVRFHYSEMESLYAKSVLGIRERRPTKKLDALSRTFDFSLDLVKRNRLLDEVFGLTPPEREGQPDRNGAICRFSFLGARFVAACRAPVKAK